MSIIQFKSAVQSEEFEHTLRYVTINFINYNLIVTRRIEAYKSVKKNLKRLRGFKVKTALKYLDENYFLFLM